MIINTNTSATLAAYNLATTNKDHQRNLGRLSSGLRINSSYDDAAGLAVSMKMSAAIRRAQSYAANVENSRSFLQTQDGALRQLGNLLERMSELKALAHDVTKNAGDVLLYEAEYVQLQEQFKSTVAEEFNGIRLFSPADQPEHLFLDHPERQDQIQVSRPTLGSLHTGRALSVGFTTTTTTTTVSEYTAIDLDNSTWPQAKLDAESRGGYLATVTSQQEWDEILLVSPAVDNRFMWLGGSDENTEGLWEWITGEPWSFEIWDPGEPNGTGNVLQKLANRPFWNDTFDNVYYTNSGYILERDINTTTSAVSHLSILDLPWSDLHATIIQVAEARAQNGAEQSQLQMAADLNSTNIVNMGQALSRIQDVDMAQTTSDLARTRVLIDAGTAMSAQANASQQSILKLIDSGRL